MHASSPHSIGNTRKPVLRQPCCHAAPSGPSPRRRLLPPLFLVSLCCQIDRSNLAFAALQMDEDLGFSRTVHGLGSGGCGLHRAPASELRLA